METILVVLFYDDLDALLDTLDAIGLSAFAIIGAQNGVRAGMDANGCLCDMWYIHIHCHISSCGRNDGVAWYKDWVGNGCLLGQSLYGGVT